MAKTRAPPNSSGGGNNKKRKFKHLLSAPESAARKGLKKAKKASNNPFESVWSRRKQDVIGKKRKGEERRVGLARSLAVEKRNKTLLKDYEQSRKSSTFVDKRIGESNAELGEYEKAIMRLQRERQTKLKKESKYNLSDEEEDNFDKGNYFSKVDDFEEEIPLDDDDEDTQAKKGRNVDLHSMHTSSESLEGDENVRKTKKQVYEEIMAKSKFHKAQKAKDKEDDELLLEQLDKDFASLAQSKALISLTQPAKITALKALLNRSHEKQFGGNGCSVSDEGILKKVKPDAYDMLVKEMVLDIRARPSDRTKTPEEIAQEEREHLEQLEEERKKRMLAIEDSDDESDDDAVNLPKSSSKELKLVSGDDLGDSISVDEQPANKTGWVDDIMGRKNVDNEEEEEEDENGGDSDEDTESDDTFNGHEKNPEKLLAMKDWEQSDEDPIADGEEGMEDTDQSKVKSDTEEHVKTQQMDILDNSKARSISKPAVIKDESLPYVIEAPNSLTELCSLLDHRSDHEMVEAIKRIRACNSIRLAAKNRNKMQVFYGVLLQYFAVLATKRPLNIRIINLLVRPLLEMSGEIPYFAAICARQRLMRIRSQFCEDVKNLETSSWPSLKTLLLLRLWSLIYPCSDFRHVVMTPATLLMCEYLMRCPIMNGRDIVVGSFLCSMILSVAKQSGKFFPEATVFIQVLLMMATDLKQGLQQLSQCYYFMDLRAMRPWLRIRDQTSHAHPIDFLMTMDMPVDDAFFDSDDFRVSVLKSVIKTLRGFVDVYESLGSFPEIFMPIAGLLDEVVKVNGMPDLLISSMEDIVQLIKEKLVQNQLVRRPLQMRKQKPVPLKLLNPKFEENYVKGRDYDPDRERVERKKLKKLLKREAKGAARELRKDNYFLFETKEKDRLLLDEERAEKYGKARAFLQEQEHAFKSGQLGKGKGKGIKRRK